jgi:predicted transcriptional regulator
MEDTRKFKTFTFRITDTLRGRLEEEAKRQDRPMAWIITRALDQLEPFDFDLSNAPLKESKARRSG